VRYWTRVNTFLKEFLLLEPATDESFANARR
jgi:hypothetical protein